MHRRKNYAGLFILEADNSFYLPRNLAKAVVRSALVMLSFGAEVNMRTFLCIPIDAPLREALSNLSGELRSLVRVRASWVKAENFHVTLRFLGEIDPMLTIELQQLCRVVTKRIRPFNLSIDRLGMFPSPERPRVLWAGGEAPSTFLDLASFLNHELVKIGFSKERKPAISHITLARIKGRADQSIGEAISSLGRLPGWTLHADRLMLMESRLSSHGAAYTPLFTQRFGDAAARGTDAGGRVNDHAI
jgi:2'-5' RNA ligase